MNNTTKRAIVEFSVQWQSPYTTHRDRVYAGKIDFWRDFFPGNMHDGIMALNIGEKYVEQFAPGILVPPYSNNHVRHIKKKISARTGLQVLLHRLTADITPRILPGNN